MRLLYVAVLALLLAPSVQAQQPDGLAAVFGSVGYMAPNDVLDADGNTVLIPGDFSVLSASFGLEIHALQLPYLTGSIGFAVDMAGETLQIGDTEFSSGVAIQNLRPYLRFATDYARFTAGLLRDQNENLDDPDAELFNTDGQNATWLALDGRYERGPFAVFGGGDAFLTSPGSSSSPNPAAFDAGDVFVVHGGVAGKTRMIEVGVRVQSISTSSATNDLADAPLGDLLGDGTRSQLGVLPYLRIDPEHDPVSFTLIMGARGGANQEYAPFGISLGGASVPAPVSPVSIHVRIDV